MRAITVRLAQWCLVATCVCSAVAYAEDCTYSKPFAITHQQVLSGRLEDLMGAGIRELRLALISEKGTVRYVKTDSSGHFDFGPLADGSYRLRLKDTAYCAPEVKCQDALCTVSDRLKLNPKRAE